ncbi:MAG: peptide chain release factor-like protein [Elusimicrobia bacterium]|nr:peptide chain release factor-like protein [Elusimicrobiota bacterium]
MDLRERFDVSQAKVEELRRRIERLKIDLKAVEECFSRGGGKGGQKRNKTSNRVTLRYSPMDLVIHCERERRRSVNRFLALRELVDQIEIRISPETSERLREFEAARRRKAKRSARAKEKYGADAPTSRLV